MKTLLNLLLKTRRRPRRHPPKPTAGYTMIELLVGMVIAALIITPMLGFVVNILNSDVKEQAKTNSEQELQAAIDYIAQDMSQAIYIYDEAGRDAIADDLPHSSDANKNPILVFWKREFVEDVVPVSGTDCTSGCNDTFVLSLVAYYEITETDSSSIWCQPSGGDCPQRIGRFQIRDGVKDLNGNYICGADGRTAATGCTNKHMRDLGYSSFDISDPTAWTANGEGYDNDVVVLVNYIEDFELLNPLVDSNNDGSIDAATGDVRLIEDSGNKLARIKIQSNALRRLQTDTNCADSPTYCPQATAQVGARSGYGTSE